jgi:hypothetical protein
VAFRGCIFNLILWTSVLFDESLGRMSKKTISLSGILWGFSNLRELWSEMQLTFVTLYSPADCFSILLGYAAFLPYLACYSLTLSFGVFIQLCNFICHFLLSSYSVYWKSSFSESLFKRTIWLFLC